MATAFGWSGPTGKRRLKTWTATDSLYGTRHLAEKWQKDGTLKKIKALMVADMIGDADLNVDRDRNSAPWLEDWSTRRPRSSAISPISSAEIAVEDDHLPFVQRGVPVAI